MARGYRPLMERSPEARRIVDEFKALSSLSEEMVKHVLAMEDDKLTRKELLNDLRFEELSLRMLERMRLFGPEETERGRRPFYSLKRTLLLMAQFPGYCTISRRHLRRKYQNITTIHRDVFQDLIAPR